jgi:NitT/TauT family transport system substrate-binding protein
VAIPSEVPTPWWCLQHDLRLAGVDPGGMTGLAFMPMGEGAAALRSGKVDAVMLFEPHAAALEEAGAVVWYAAASRGPTAYSALYATAPRIAARRAAFESAVKGLGDALAWLGTATEEAIAATLALRFPDVPPDRLRRAIARYQGLGLWATGTALPPQALDRLAASMISAGAMTHHPGYESCIDTSLGPALAS